MIKTHLEPNLDLALGEAESVRDLYASPGREHYIRMIMMTMKRIIIVMIENFERSVMMIVIMMIVTGNVGPTSPYFSKLKNNISFTCASDNG